MKVLYWRVALLMIMLLGALIPAQTSAGLNPEPGVMTTLSLMVLSGTTAAGMGGLILVDRERYLRDHAVALLDDLTTGDTASLSELATIYVPPARREEFVGRLLAARRAWRVELVALLRGERAARVIDHALRAL